MCDCRLRETRDSLRTSARDDRPRRQGAVAIAAVVIRRCGSLRLRLRCPRGQGSWPLLSRLSGPALMPRRASRRFRPPAPQRADSRDAPSEPATIDVAAPAPEHGVGEKGEATWPAVASWFHVGARMLRRAVGSASRRPFAPIWIMSTGTTARSVRGKAAADGLRPRTSAARLEQEAAQARSGLPFRPSRRLLEVGSVAGRASASRFAPSLSLGQRCRRCRSRSGSPCAAPRGPRRLPLQPVKQELDERAG